MHRFFTPRWSWVTQWAKIPCVPGSLGKLNCTISVVIVQPYILEKLDVNWKLVFQNMSELYGTKRLKTCPSLHIFTHPNTHLTSKMVSTFFTKRVVRPNALYSRKWKYLKPPSLKILDWPLRTRQYRLRTKVNWLTDLCMIWVYDSPLGKIELYQHFSIRGWKLTLPTENSG